jgi:hypothetical protein
VAKPSPSDYQPMEFPSQGTSFDPDAFDELIRTQGVDMVHYRAMPCPVGLIDPEDQRHPRDHHENCSNGYVYTLGGAVICSFMSNSKESRQIDIGRLDGSSVTVTFPRYYERDNINAPIVPVQPAPFDRLYLKDESVTVITWEKFACSISGVDRVRFPALHVTDIMDAKGIRYTEGSDFVVSAGKIKWFPGRSPGQDIESKRGVVCSVRYEYRPFWYVQRMIHEVRVAQVEDEMGIRQTMRFPQQMLLQREAVFENEQNDAQTKASPRKNPGPDDSPFDIGPNLGTK